MLNPLLPPSNNAQYSGAAFVPYALMVLGLGEFFPSLIHSFKPDGGAFSIAHIAPANAAEGARIVALFAWAGATQLAYALIILAVALRYRAFTAAMLLIMLLEKTILALDFWWLKAGSAPYHHPPAHFGALIALPILSFLFISSRRKRA